MLFITDGYVIDPKNGTEAHRDIRIADGVIREIAARGAFEEEIEAAGRKRDERPDGAAANTVVCAAGCIVAPGLIDGHVHFRDPGQTYKEDIMTGAAAAARGGFTSVVMMGNTIPRMDTPETIAYALEKGARSGIHIYAVGNVTENMEGKELTDFAALSAAGATLLTDDGMPILSEEVMRRACVRAAMLRKMISLHEEDPRYIRQNGIHAGAVAQAMGLEGADREAEISMVRRDIRIAEETGAEITIQHISAAESVALIREARKRYPGIHAEATPHHFSLTEAAVAEKGTLAKMNPPLRLESDRRAIIEGLRDGTIESIATDHAPHAMEEKARPFTEAPSGITGLETALSLGIRELVRPGYLTMRQLIERMSCGPASVLGIPGGGLEENGPADVIVFDPDVEWRFDETKSKNANTPFFGERLPGVVRATICGGRIVYRGTERRE